MVNSRQVDGKEQPAVMQKRRSHTKSRNGCTACKKSHVKCDEGEPRCSNCTVRDLQCIYTRIRSARLQRNSPLPPKDTATGPRAEAPILWTSDASAPRAQSTLLELELMNRWSTVTWKGSQSFDSDWRWLSVLLPREALTLPFLMDALLGAAALDLALAQSDTARTQVYVKSAMAYYDSSSIELRAALAAPAKETYWIVVTVSQILGAMNLCIPQCLSKGHFAEQSALDRMNMSFALLVSSSKLVAQYLDWLMDTPYPLRELVSHGVASNDLISDDIRIGLRDLRALNESIHSAQTRDFYKVAISHLERCFAEDAKGAIRGYYAGFPGLVGEKFPNAVAERDPFALLIIFYWTTMMHKSRDQYWWASRRSIMDLATSVDAELRQQNVTHDPEWKVCIDFAWHQIK